MGIKYNEITKFYEVSYSKRHPITGMPYPVRRKNIKSMAEAKRIYNDIVVLVNEKLRRTVVPTWEALLDRYFLNISTSNIMQMTIYNREKVLRRHTLPFWEGRLVSDIKTEDIYKLLNERLGQNAEAHRKYFIKCIKSIFQYAVGEGILNRNPTPLMKFRVSDKIKSVLNEEQIVVLLGKAQEQEWHWYPHYAVGLYTGLRNGELYALTWDKVNFEQRQILVNCSWSSKDGYKSTKSGDDRIVEIPKPLIPLLLELKMKSDGSDFVLPRLSKWDKGEQARELRFFLKSIGLPEIRFHDLRASWATLLLGKGVAASKVMSMGGWKDMDTMMVYMRKAGTSIKDATSCLDDMKTHGIRYGTIHKFNIKGEF